MTITPGDLMNRLATHGYQPRLIPGGEGVSLVHRSQHYRDPQGVFEMVLELRPDPGGSVLKVVGPRLAWDWGYEGWEALTTAFIEVQSACHLLRIVRDPEGRGLCPQLEYPCLPKEAPLSDVGLCDLLDWAARNFDRALGYLEQLVRTGRGDHRLLACDPPELLRLQERARDLQIQLEETEREIDRVRRPLASCSHILPQFF